MRPVALLLGLFCSGFLAAEEVLSSRPLVISPKRIETKTVLPPKVIAEQKVEAAKKAPKKTEPKVAQKAKAKEDFLINMNQVILKIDFNPGSIQLSTEARQALKSLALQSGQKIRISGFGENGRRNGKRVAHFRARVVASFLDEVFGGVNAQMQWSATQYPCCGTAGAVIEKTE